MAHTYDQAGWRQGVAGPCDCTGGFLEVPAERVLNGSAGFDAWPRPRQRAAQHLAISALQAIEASPGGPTAFSHGMPGPPRDGLTKAVPKALRTLLQATQALLAARLIAPDLGCEPEGPLQVSQGGDGARRGDQWLAPLRCDPAVSTPLLLRHRPF